MSEEQISPQSSDVSPQEDEDSLQEEEKIRAGSVSDRSEPTAKQSLTVPPENPQVSSPVPQVSQKTQGVRPGRDHGVGVLQSAAKKAARSNSRSDVHEYMRLRRSYI